MSSPGRPNYGQRMVERVQKMSRCSTQLAYGLAEARRRLRFGLQSLIPSFGSEGSASADLFGTANVDARAAYRNGRACMDPNVALYDTAISWFSRAIALDPKYAQARICRAECFLKLRNVDDAITDFTECLATANCDDDLKVRVLLGRASVHKTRGDFSKALKDLSDAIDLHPNSVEARLKRSAVYLDVKKLREALADADTAVELEPGNPLALAQLGVVQSAFGNHQQAARSCGLAISAAPPTGCPEPFLARAQVLLADDRPTESLIDTNEAIERGGGIDAYLMRAKGNITLELWDDAISDLTKSYRLNPDDCNILMERAFCFEQLGKFELAIRDRAQALRVKGDCDEAITAFERESLHALKLRKNAAVCNQDWDSDHSL